jgi:hypothetical protein
MTSPASIEAAARAMWQSEWGTAAWPPPEDPEGAEAYRALARAALTALTALTVRASPDREDIVIVPIEIRQGVTVKIALPANITKTEAEKVAAVVVAYATETNGES